MTYIEFKFYITKYFKLFDNELNLTKVVIFYIIIIKCFI